MEYSKALAVIRRTIHFQYVTCWAEWRSKNNRWSRIICLRNRGPYGEVAVWTCNNRIRLHSAAGFQLPDDVEFTGIHFEIKDCKKEIPPTYGRFGTAIKELEFFADLLRKEGYEIK